MNSAHAGVGLGVPLGVGVGVAGGVGEETGVGVGDATVVERAKFESEISKKTFPTASTFMRAEAVVRLGRVTGSLPSFAVDAARTVGKVAPPSVESEILTFAVLTGAAEVLATSQATVMVDPGKWLDPPFGEVILKGPLLPSTASVEVAVLNPPADARLSRAIT